MTVDDSDDADNRHDSTRNVEPGRDERYRADVIDSDPGDPGEIRMAVTLPYMNGLFAFADAGDVAEMTRQLRLRGAGGPTGYEFDPRRTDARATVGGATTETDGATVTDADRSARTRADGPTRTNYATTESDTT